MTALISKFFGSAPDPIPAGIYHYQSNPDEPIQYRLHLRIEPDQQGLLIINAATVLHLNESAAAHAYAIVQGSSVAEAASDIVKRYRVGRKQARADQESLRQRIVTLATFPDVDPVTFLGLDRTEPYAATPSAPYRMDLALTYLQDPDGALDPLARERVDRELDFEEWKQVLQKLRHVGIPHVTFTGGEPTRREDLVDLIRYAEELGQVTGVLTEGRRLSDGHYLEALAQAGLDHLLIALVLEDEHSKAGLINALASDIFTAVHLTIANTDWNTLKPRLHELESMGVTAISLSINVMNDTNLQLLQDARQLVAELDMDLIWDIPAPYSMNNPITAEVDEEPQGAGKAWLYIEPDADVLPAQGVNLILGNILQDEWDQIWQKALGSHE
ncbi:MAG: radical SAM protein [Phycisphaerae bacterium]|nr:radical SAM protein [Phycisphaerae bacterium]